MGGKSLLGHCFLFSRSLASCVSEGISEATRTMHPWWHQTVVSHCHGSSRKQNWICYKKYSLRLAEHWSEWTFNLTWSVVSGKSHWHHSSNRAHRTRGSIMCWGRHLCLLPNVQAYDSSLTTWPRSVVLSATQSTKLVPVLKTVCSGTAGWENHASDQMGILWRLWMYGNVTTVSLHSLCLSSVPIPPQFGDHASTLDPGQFWGFGAFYVWVL